MTKTIEEINSRVAKRKQDSNSKDPFPKIYEGAKTVVFWFVLLTLLYMSIFGGNIHIDYGDAAAVTKDFVRALGTLF